MSDLYKCGDCGRVTEEIRWLDDNHFVSECCDAECTEARADDGDHDDPATWEPARAGRVL